MSIYTELSGHHTFETAGRQRVEEILEQAVKHPLVILHGEEGHGKTQAVSSWLVSSGKQVVWLHLTELDNYEARFWKKLIQSISLWCADLAGQMEKEPFPNSLPSTGRFLELFSQAICHRKKLILVLDDFQNLRNGPVRNFIQVLIQSQLEGLSVILISGTVVSSGISGIVRTVHLTDRQLRFTREEIQIYYTALGIELTEETLEQAYQITQGWAYAVYLLGVRLYKKEQVLPEHLDDAAVGMFEILDQDIFSKLPPNVKKALTLLSMLREFTLEMAAALTGISGSLLVTFLDKIPLISIHINSSTYYFHRLMQQFLIRRQTLVNSKTRHSFLLRAGRLYEKNEEIFDAVSCYFQCGAYAEIEQLLVKLGGFYTRQDIAAGCLELLDHIPKQVLYAYPYLGLMRIHIMLILNRDSVEDELRNFQNYLSTDLQDARKRTAYGELCIFQAFSNLRKGSPDFVHRLQEAAEYLPDGSTLLSGRDMMFLGYGSAAVSPGNESGSQMQMLQTLFDAMPLAEQLLNGLGWGLENLAAAETWFLTGQLEQAEQYAWMAAAKASEKEQWDIVCNSYFCLMRIGMARGSLQMAQENLKLMQECAAKCSGSDFFILPEIAQGVFCLKIGQRYRMPRWVSDDTLGDQGRIQIGSGREYVLRTMYFIHSGRNYEALACIEAGKKVCGTSGQWESALELLILEAVACDLSGNRKKAAACMQQAYDLSVGSNIVMPFVEYGIWTVHLIDHIFCESHAIETDWLNLIRSESFVYSENLKRMAGEYRLLNCRQASPVESLTQQELQVLLFLCKNFSNKEIAEQLGFSDEEAGDMVKQICVKLKALNREDALRILMEEFLRTQIKISEA